MPVVAATSRLALRRMKRALLKRRSWSAARKVDRAFAVVPIGEDIGPPGARTLVGHIHRVPAVLRDPVGARVFVDLRGNARQVIYPGQV